VASRELPGTIAIKVHWVRAYLGAVAVRRRVELLLFATVLVSVAYFFQGGGWNQNAHFATTVALVEQRTFYLDDYRRSSGDLARAGEHVTSAKPVGTALAMVPGYLVARTVTLGIDNVGNQTVARAYLTTVLGPGVALALLAVVLFTLFRRRLSARDAMWVSLGVTLATPLFPFSTMTNSTPFVALFALLAYALLDEGELDNRGLVLAGLCAGLPATFEYQTAVVVLPLALFALFRLADKKRFRWVALGIGLAACVPFVHHMVVYGNPLHVGYAAMANPGMARSAAHGWFGFDGPEFNRFYELTLGHRKGFFFASPFLLAAVPGLVRMLRDPETRSRGLTAGGAAWLMLLIVASLSYWHSGWGISSRYAVLFIVFSAIPLAAIFPAHRGWILAGMGLAMVFMLLAVSVTATPPPGGPPHLSVYGWLRDQLLDGKIAIRNENVLMMGDSNGDRTWRTSFNLGLLVGLPGPWSLLPYLALLGAGVRSLWVASREP